MTTELAGKHAAKHTRKGSEIDPSNAIVRLSDKLKSRFQELYDATCDDRYLFDTSIHVSIAAFSQQPETNLKELVRELPKIMQETERYAATTGKANARDALSGMLAALEEERSFMLVRSPAKSHREA